VGRDGPTRIDAAPENVVAPLDSGRLVVDGFSGDASAGECGRQKRPHMTLANLGTAIGDRLGRHRAAVRALSPVYARWLRAAYGRRGLRWHVNGEPMRIDPASRHLMPHRNEPELFHYLREQIRPGDVILDIGAFLGGYAIPLARWAGAHGRVLAFEPSPASFATLCRHLEMNGFGPPRVVARCAAVGARDERRGLITFEGEPYRNMIVPEGAPASSTVVEVVTVDSICATLGRPPDWIRMDVQGLEFDVLRGAGAVLREGGGRLRIVAEVHPDQWPDYGIDPGTAADRLAAIGLRARPLRPGDNPFEQSAHAVLEPLR
jgi:FkbM family methyltransferase